MLAGDYVEGEPKLEQYRTTNLVSQGRTINVIGYTGNNANGLDATHTDRLTVGCGQLQRLEHQLKFHAYFWH